MLTYRLNFNSRKSDLSRLKFGNPRQPVFWQRKRRPDILLTRIFRLGNYRTLGCGGCCQELYFPALAFGGQRAESQLADSLRLPALRSSG